jgi:hypothetical protein
MREQLFVESKGEKLNKENCFLWTPQSVVKKAEMAEE